MRTQLVFTELDRFRLGTLLDSRCTKAISPARLRDELEWRIEEAVSVAPEEVAPDVVTMNSRVRVVRLDGDQELTCAVVYPGDVDLVARGVSVLEPLGSALIGHEVGDVVECHQGEAAGRWRITGIVSQPEQVGDFHL